MRHQLGDQHHNRLSLEDNFPVGLLGWTSSARPLAQMHTHKERETSLGHYGVTDYILCVYVLEINLLPITKLYKV